MFRRVKRRHSEALISGNNYKYHWKVHSSRAMFSIIITFECKCHLNAFVGIMLSMQLAGEEEEERDSQSMMILLFYFFAVEMVTHAVMVKVCMYNT